MKFRLALIATFASMIGCGDNSNECGPGTQAVDGLCTPTSTATCSDGTILDTASGGCVIDPTSCQDGTVLIGAACVDPGHVTADLEEGPEPNGLGIFGESSNAGAGTIALKPVGSHFVVHGHIIPFQDGDGDGQTDPDYDTYTVSVSGPTLITISADGLHGLAAGFATVAAVDANDPLATWHRLGVNLTGDTSKRQVYLPQPGTYALVIADTRTLLLAGGAAGANMGSPDFEYYISIDALAAPVPQTLTVTAGQATSTGTLNPGEVKFFTVPMGTGFNKVTFDATATQVVESVVVANTHGTASSIKGVANADTSTAPASPASLTSIGYFDGDTTLIVADNVYNYASDPTDYTLTVDTHTAGALSKTGGTSMVDTDAVNLSTFYYDVASADEFTGLNISVDKPVSGVILDQNGFIFSYFTYDPNSFVDPFDLHFTKYKGLIREPSAGRYYLAIVDEALSGTDTGTVTATSTYGAVTAVAVTEGTVTGSQAINAYTSNPFTYAAGTDAWQAFGATGGAVTARFFTSDSYGRLDTFKTGDATCVTAAGVDGCLADVTPLWTPTLTGAPKGRILLDDGTTNYLVVAHPTLAFTLDFENRANTVLTAVAGGAPVTDTTTLDTTTTVRRYLVKTAATNNLAVSVDGNAVTDAVLTNVDNTETALRTANTTGLDGIESFQTIQGGNGWTGVTVNAVTPAAAQGFTISATATAGITYAKSAGTTAFADACAGGTAVTLSNSDEGVSTTAISAPANFKLFGFAAPTFHVFSNGFLSFETATCISTGSSCYFSNTTLPTTANPNAIIAPYWDDLDISSVCTKVAGTKLIVQWTGTPFGGTEVVDFQAILDGSNNTIEFVYAADQDATEDGGGATVGVESTGGLAGYVVGFNAAATVTAGTAIKLTPM